MDRLLINIRDELVAWMYIDAVERQTRNADADGHQTQGPKAQNDWQKVDAPALASALEAAVDVDSAATGALSSADSAFPPAHRADHRPRK